MHMTNESLLFFWIGLELIGLSVCYKISEQLGKCLGEMLSALARYFSSMARYDPNDSLRNQRAKKLASGPREIRQ
jgi:hypothetical protein